MYMDYNIDFDVLCLKSWTLITDTHFIKHVQWFSATVSPAPFPCWMISICMYMIMMAQRRSLRSSMQTSCEKNLHWLLDKMSGKLNILSWLWSDLVQMSDANNSCWTKWLTTQILLEFSWYCVCMVLFLQNSSSHDDSLRSSDAIWLQRSGSTLAQVMACCLTAPSHYLKQCWLIINKVQWHLSRASSQEMPRPSISITEINLKIAYLKFHSNFPGANELIASVCQPPSSLNMSCLLVRSDLHHVTCLCGLWTCCWPDPGIWGTIM